MSEKYIPKKISINYDFSSNKAECHNCHMTLHRIGTTFFCKNANCKLVNIHYNVTKSLLTLEKV